MKFKIILSLAIFANFISTNNVFAATTLSAKCESPFTVGYKKIVAPIGGRRASVSIWYPSRGAETKTTYDLNRHLGSGQAALEAPAASDCQAFPLLIFSHGYHGCALQSLFLTEYLAQRGYVVVAPDHQDAACNAKNPLPSFLNLDLKQFQTPEIWNDQTYLDRRDDIHGTLDEILRLNRVAGSFLYQKIDGEKVGMLGHSLGGYTGLGIAGAWPSWKDSRVKVLVAFSPYAQPYLINKAIKNIKVPVLLEGGTLDRTITPYFDQIYPQLQVPKEMAILEGAGHLAWSNVLCRSYADSRACITGNENAQIIITRATSFFDRYLLDKQAAKDAPAAISTVPSEPEGAWRTAIIIALLIIIVHRLWIST